MPGDRRGPDCLESEPMAYDEALAARVREMLEASPEISERKMFGGIAFMLSGNMAVGVSKDELMV
ncbi:MAG: TfoX/Sxy family protein, partial [Acidimicrobiia bacterium]